MSDVHPHPAHPDHQPQDDAVEVTATGTEVALDTGVNSAEVVEVDALPVEATADAAVDADAALDAAVVVDADAALAADAAVDAAVDVAVDAVPVAADTAVVVPAPPPYPALNHPQADTSASTTAMVFGIIAAACTALALLIALTAPFAIVFGVIAVVLAYKDRRLTPPRGASPGANLAALICGYVSIAVSAMLMLATVALFAYLLTT